MKIRHLSYIIVSSILLSSYAYGAVREYNLTIAQQPVTIRDKTAEGMTINGSIPGPILRFNEGDMARIHVRNNMNVATSFHWHGLLVPPSMDGVPFVTQVPISPGDTFTYEFPIRQTGTYWYHSHSELQEQRGLYGAIAIEDGNYHPAQDYVVLLSDWTTDSPDLVLKNLKRGSEWYALQKGSSQSILGAAKAGRLGDYFKRELQRMPPMDLADVAYDYFLSNGSPSLDLEGKSGETIRLRIINGSATTYFHLNFSGGPMTIISADGQLVEPVEKDLFLIGVAETYDILVRLPGNGSYELRATAHDGSGYTSTWIGKGKKFNAENIPHPELYEPMEHGEMGSALALTPSGSMGMTDSMVERGLFDKPGMGHVMHEGEHDKDSDDHSMMGGHETSMKTKHDGMSMEKNKEHKQPEMGSDMSMESPEVKKADHSKMVMPSAMDMSKSGHEMSKHTDSMPEAPTPEKGHEQHEDLDSPTHARSFGNDFEFLGTDIASRQVRASEGSTARPGTPYQDLKSRRVTSLPDGVPVREIRLTLDGDMQRYTWFLNKKPLSESDSIKIREGEATRFIMINRTMMHHPMHLHGHFFRVVNSMGDYSPLKHTVDVAPMSTTVIEFYNDEKGDWFFHCHLLYHMKSGMARLVHYEDFEPLSEVRDSRSRLYKDPFYFHGMADISSNMTEGALTVENSRLAFEAAWEVGWQGVEKTEWEGLLTADYHVNRFTSFLVGANFLGEDTATEETRGVLGVRYLLPLNFESISWIDTDGGARFFLAKELELTPRFGVHGEAEYDTHTQWEGKVGLSYLISRDISIIGNWHSEYGLGIGLQIRF